MKDGTPNFIYLLETINGRSFPATERLTYERGQTVRWAVFNASSSMNHPMHLHGFYYRLDARERVRQVTHAFFPGEAEELSWTADRAGKWMFHCHIDDHITRHAPLADMLAGKADPQLTVAKRFHLPNEPMGGMVIALDVLPRSGDRAPAVPQTPRQLTLLYRVARRADAPYIGLAKGTVRLTDGDQTTQSNGNLGTADRARARQAGRDHGGQSDARADQHALARRLHFKTATSMAAAGMGMAMDGERMSPPIDPGASFVARFTPPDAGTFMYHAHMDDGWQLAEGPIGPLIVMPPGEAFDPVTDHS